MSAEPASEVASEADWMSEEKIKANLPTTISLPPLVLLPGQGLMTKELLRAKLPPASLEPFLSDTAVGARKPPKRGEEDFDMDAFLSDRLTKYTEKWYREEFPGFSEIECRAMAMYSAGMRYKQLKSILKKQTRLAKVEAAQETISFD
jgi:hypothetical protein